MHIYPINSNNNANYINKTMHFGGLIKDKSALPLIKSMSDEDKFELKKIEKNLSKTKFWDMKISSISNEFKEFKFKFINKKNGGVITDAIYPYNQKGQTIRFYSIIYGPENTLLNNVGTLRFKSEIRAEELFNKYQENFLYARNRGYNITPIESLKMKEVELSMLEEASETTNGKRNIKQVNTESKTKQTTGNDLLFND